MHARLLTGAALAAVLAIPAAAQADTTLMAGPLKVRDYRMTIVGNDGARDSLTVMFHRAAGRASQMHTYAFTQGVKVTPTSIAGSLGRYGAVRLKLAGARAGKAAVPAGCTGSPGTTKRGTMTGSFKLVADTTYFRTVTARKLAGSASSGGELTCSANEGGAAAGGPMLMLNRQDGGAMTMLMARKDGQTVMRTEDPAATAPAAIAHMITAEGAALQHAGDFSSATVTGLSPFLTGSGAFAGQSYGTGAFGTLSGDLTARFDSVGPVTFAGEATITGG